MSLRAVAEDAAVRLPGRQWDRVDEPASDAQPAKEDPPPSAVPDARPTEAENWLPFIAICVSCAPFLGAAIWMARRTKAKAREEDRRENTNFYQGRDALRRGDLDLALSCANEEIRRDPKRSLNPLALTGFIIGLSSTVLYGIGLIPILGIVFSAIGLGKVNPETQKGKWMAGWGLGLSILYTVMYLTKR